MVLQGKLMLIVGLVVTILLLNNGCKPRQTTPASDLQSILDGEPPAGSGVSISSSEETDILAAMHEAHDRGMTSVGLNPSLAADVIKYQKDRVEPCLANDVGRWSDFVIHYYCQHGAVRSCFTTQAKDSAGSFTDPEKHYRETYKFCEGKVGTDKEWQWLTSDAKRAAIFKYIMFTNGRSQFVGKPDAFNQDDQDRVINKYYGVTDPKNSAECHKRPPRNKSQEPDPVDSHCGVAVAQGTAPAKPSTPAAPVTPTPAKPAAPPTTPVVPVSTATIPVNPPQLPPITVSATPTVSTPIAAPMKVSPVRPTSPITAQVPVAPKPVSLKPGSYRLQGTNCDASLSNIVNDASRANDLSAFRVDFGSTCGASSGKSVSVRDCVSGLCPWQVGAWRTVETLVSSGSGFTIATNPPSQWITSQSQQVDNCLDHWVKIPGNTELGTKDFCVMKYEAKNVGGKATSQPAERPWVNINRDEAVTACQVAGAYLLTNAQWQTIARNIEAVAINWRGGNSSSDHGINHGHSDEGPDYPLDAPDQQSGVVDHCFKTLERNCDSFLDPSSGNIFIQKRTHSLSSGDLIWDFSGNVWEWVANPYISRPPSMRDMQICEIAAKSYKDNWGPAGDYSLKGKWDCGGLGNAHWSDPRGAIMRGGSWRDYTHAGVFAFDVNSSPTASSDAIGFRCAR